MDSTISKVFFLQKNTPCMINAYSFSGPDNISGHVPKDCEGELTGNSHTYRQPLSQVFIPTCLKAPTIIRRVSSTKFLGAHFSEDLSWTTNTSSLAKRVTNDFTSFAD
ncbi:unnamed protein product [Menidia menidia]|uniref:(Atlantic silverside) hypothetical protein n=1 Tax=Menidia menidia TaxID=238744 RepID=A0A8S4AB87_9TELE|nr:unnamed protein product [Menidia menidia]